MASTPMQPSAVSQPQEPHAAESEVEENKEPPPLGEGRANEEESDKARAPETTQLTKRSSAPFCTTSQVIVGCESMDFEDFSDIRNADGYSHS